MKVKFVFFPVPFRFGWQAYNNVCSGFVGREYFECIKYEDGRFDEALDHLSAYRNLKLVEVDKATLPNLDAINDRFKCLLLKGQTIDVIRVVVQED
jgi:hypothetical protein